MRRFLRASLVSRGFRLVEAATAGEVAALVTSHSPEVILLDLGLPDGDGIELARDIRQWSRVPIIVISARGREADKVEALDAGADDYLRNHSASTNSWRAFASPFGERENGASATPIFDLGPLRIDFARRE